MKKYKLIKWIPFEFYQALYYKKKYHFGFKCKKCKALNKIFNKKTMKTNYDYWLMTEVFVFLHEGKDYCNNRK